MKEEDEKREVLRKKLELEQERAEKNAEEVATLALQSLLNPKGKKQKNAKNDNDDSNDFIDHK
jgi:hypothetical protein